MTTLIYDGVEAIQEITTDIAPYLVKGGRDMEIRAGEPCWLFLLDVEGRPTGVVNMVVVERLELHYDVHSNRAVNLKVIGSYEMWGRTHYYETHKLDTELAFYRPVNNAAGDLVSNYYNQSESTANDILHYR